LGQRIEQRQVIVGNCTVSDSRRRVMGRDRKAHEKGYRDWSDAGGRRCKSPKQC